MNRARLALTAGISIVLVFLSFPGISIAKWGNDYRKQTFSIRLVWKTSGEEKLFSEDEGFPPQKIKEELERNDASEEDKEWLLNALRIIVARQERVLYTNDGEAIDLPKDDLLRWSIAASKNSKYLMLCPRRWDEEGKQSLSGTARLKPHDIGFDFLGSEKVEQAKRDWEKYQRQEKQSDFILMDSDGNELWRQHNMPGRTYISNNAKTVVATHRGHFFSVASFYDRKGNLLRKVRFPYGAGGNADLSADGGLFVVLAGLASEDGRSTLIGYDRTGKKLWERKLRGGPTVSGDIKVISVSDDGSFTVTSIGDKTHFLGRKGKLLGSIDISNAYCQDFSADGNYLLLSKNRELKFVKTQPLTVLWGYRPDHKVRRLAGGVIVPNKELVLAALATRKGPHDCDVCILGNGQILDTILTLPGQGASLLTSPNGRFLVVSVATFCAVYDIR